MKPAEKINHLYWRAGFGLSPEEWSKKKDWSVKQAVERLFEDSAKAKIQLDGSEFLLNSSQKKGKLSKEQMKKMAKQSRGLIVKQNALWVTRMADDTESALLERMSLFWHGHFACINKSSSTAYHQLNTIRKHALGNFREFVHAMCKDVSMIKFLNNQQNRKRKPNENFARELLELFTIGRGNYSEQDIKEAARAFTGWSCDKQGNFIFKERNHDYDSKTFMGKTGDFNGDDVVKIVLDRPETATHITRKIYRYFINEKVDEKRVKELATAFYKSDYDIKKLMLRIFKSDWFYDAENIGTKIKSPIELLAGVMRSLHLEFKDPKSLLFAEKALGQILFIPPNVAGWPGGKNWIDNSTLMLRLNLVYYLYGKSDVNFKVKDELEAKKRGQAFRKLKGSINFKPLIKTFDNKSNAATFEELKTYLLLSPTRLNASDFDAYVYNTRSSDYVKSLAMRLMSLPEYQLC